MSTRQWQQKPRRVFPWIFFSVQVLFILWIVIGQVRTAGGDSDCTASADQLCSSASSIGYSIGRGVALVFQIFMWVAVDIVLGIGYMVVRSSNARLGTQVPAPTTYAADQRYYPPAQRIQPGPSAESPEVLFNSGLQFQKQGNLIAAQHAYTQAAASGHPEAAPCAALNLGVLLNQRGDVAGAGAAFRAAMDSNHRDASPTGALNLGDVLRDTGDTVGARIAYQYAIDSNHHGAAPKAVDRLIGLI